MPKSDDVICERSHKSIISMRPGRKINVESCLKQHFSGEGGW